MSLRKRNETLLALLKNDQPVDNTSSGGSRGSSTPSFSSQNNPVDITAENSLPSVTNDHIINEPMFGFEREDFRVPLLDAEDKALNLKDTSDQILFRKPITDEPHARFQANREGSTAPSTSSQEIPCAFPEPRPPVNQPMTDTSSGVKLSDVWRLENLFPSQNTSQFVHGPRNRFPATHKTPTAPSPSRSSQENPGSFLGPRPSISQPMTNTFSSADNSTLSWRKHKLVFFIQMITSLESTSNDVDAIEADIRYTHLTSLYQSFMSNMDELVPHVSSTVFNRLLPIFKAMQQKVISLQVSLRKIMLNKSSSSAAFKANDRIDQTVRHDFTTASNSQASTSGNGASLLQQLLSDSEQNDGAKSDDDAVVTKRARTDAHVPTDTSNKSSNLPSNTTTTSDTACRNVDELILNFVKNPSEFNNKIPVSEEEFQNYLSKHPPKTAQLLMATLNYSHELRAESETVQSDELVNKTKTMTLDDAYSKSMETDDQANQAKQTENNDKALFACLAKQKEFLKELDKMESNFCGDQDLLVLPNNLLFLRESFISNQKELEKYLSPIEIRSQHELTQDVLRVVSDLEIATRFLPGGRN